MEDTIILRTSIVIPAEWRGKLDQIKKKKGYVSDADLIRDLLRDLIEREEAVGGDPAPA